MMFDGDLYAAGRFEETGADPAADFLVRWDGTSWSKVGTAPGGGAVFNGPVRALAVSNAILYAGGKFTDAGGDPAADYVAKWDGHEWSALGSNGSGGGAIPTTSEADVIALAPDGDSIDVGGVFDNAGAHPAADNIAR
jgi:hypothetical protein